MTPAAFIDRLATLAPRSATAAVFALWAAAEAFVLPIVPDVGLCLVVLAAPKQAGRLLAAIVAGAVVGSLLLAVFVVRAPDASQAMLVALPGIDRSVLLDAERQLAGEGIAGFAQVGIGPPLKVYTSAWIDGGGDGGGIVVGAILNRLTRVGLPLLGAAIAGALLGPWIRRHAGRTVAAYGLFWIAVYASIWT